MVSTDDAGVAERVRAPRHARPGEEERARLLRRQQPARRAAGRDAAREAPRCSTRATPRRARDRRVLLEPPGASSSSTPPERSAPHPRLPPVRHPHAASARRSAQHLADARHRDRHPLPGPDPPPAGLARRVRRERRRCRAPSRWRDEILSLPVHPDLTDAEVERVAESVARLLRLMSGRTPAGALHRRPGLRRGGQRRAAARGADARWRRALGRPYEIIFVNDGSRDAHARAARGASRARDPHLRDRRPRRQLRRGRGAVGRLRARARARWS